MRIGLVGVKSRKSINANENHSNYWQRGFLHAFKNSYSTQRVLARGSNRLPRQCKLYHWYFCKINQVHVMSWMHITNSWYNGATPVYRTHVRWAPFERLLLSCNVIKFQVMWCLVTPPAINKCLQHAWLSTDQVLTVNTQTHSARH